MPARAPQIVLTDKERARLEHLAVCYSRPYREVQRAKLILDAAAGMSNVEIANRLEMAPAVVGRWRRRFHEERMAALRDRPRSGRPQTRTSESK